MNNNLDLNYQYSLYLQRVALSEDKMHPQQRVETKRAFMGACGQMLILMRDEVGELSEEEGVEIFKNLLDQVLAFWQSQKHETN